MRQLRYRPGTRPAAVPDSRRLPRGPFWSCDNEFCAEEVSYPADMLRWVPALSKWLCDPSCIHELPDGTDLGGTLEGFLVGDWEGQQVMLVPARYSDE